MPCDIWWTPVWHASYAYPLFCVKVRVKKKIWYLITNEPVKTEAQAWEIVFTYKRRWQIETSFRYGKCELAMESPRLWAFENRLKLLSIVTLVYAFLLHLLEPLYRELCPIGLASQMSPNRKAVPRSSRTALPITLGNQSPLGRLSPNSWEHFPSKFGDHSGFGIFQMLKGFRKNSG